MFSSSISFGLALATAHLHPSVDLITAARRSRFFSVSFFESFISLHAPTRSCSASASGTDTAAAYTPPARGPRPASSIPITGSPTVFSISSETATAHPHHFNFSTFQLFNLSTFQLFNLSTFQPYKQKARRMGRASRLNGIDEPSITSVSRDEGHDRHSRHDHRSRRVRRRSRRVRRRSRHDALREAWAATR